MSSVVEEALYRRVSSLIIAGLAVIALVTSNWLSGKDLLQFRGGIETIWKLLGMVFSAYFGLRFVFEKWLWRLRFFQGKLVKVPDLSGKWIANLHSYSFDTYFEREVEILHKFDRMIYTSWGRNPDRTVISKEVGIATEIKRTDSQEVHLIVVYQNQPGSKMDSKNNSHQHVGCAYLRLVDEAVPRGEWELSGEYWTDKPWDDEKRVGTRGEIKLRRLKSPQ
jgi:hypothetical protein